MTSRRFESLSSCPMIWKGEKTIMTSSNNSNKLVNPNAREAMNRFKMETATEVGVSAPS